MMFFFCYKISIFVYSVDYVFENINYKFRDLMMGNVKLDLLCLFIVFICVVNMFIV